LLFSVLHLSLIPVDGVHPEAGLTLGSDGNFYGTTRDGGSNNLGTIFRLTPNGVLTSLFSFSGTNGSAPQGALTLGEDGNFYGTTVLGGVPVNFGTVFRFSTNGTFASIVAFGGTNGANPKCQLVTDAAGNFYGTAFVQGGDLDGLVFRVTTNGVLTTLVTLKDTEDGLTLGTDGNFYGTTPTGGSNNSGAVFRVTPGGVLTTLVPFSLTNGSSPLGGLVQANDGTLYGTTSFGGANLDFGTIFKVTTNGVLTDLFHFHFTDGERPASKLIFGLASPATHRPEHRPHTLMLLNFSLTKFYEDPKYLVTRVSPPLAMSTATPPVVPVPVHAKPLPGYASGVR
jgi:uncharacterized repeat protein (TIGR03803 family)